jgi:hypothetical protein
VELQPHRAQHVGEGVRGSVQQRVHVHGGVAEQRRGAGGARGRGEFGSDGAGGVWKTTNFGDTWSPSETGYPAAWNAWELVVQPSSPESVDISASANTGSSPAGILKSVDGGATWVQQGNNATFRTMAGDDDDLGTLYGIEAFNNSRPRRSVDEGVSFQRFDTGFISTAGGRDVVYGGYVNGVRRLYIAMGEGGFATDLDPVSRTCTNDYNDDGDVGTDADIEAFFACLAGNCCATCPSDADFNGDGDVGTDEDIESFFRVLAGGAC